MENWQVADALSLLATIVMAWNRVQMQRILGSENVPSALIGRIAPTHIKGLNLRGVFRFPIEEYADRCCRRQSGRPSNRVMDDVRNAENVTFALANGKY